MSTPYLTPQRLLNDRRLPSQWLAARVAFVCFTPFPPAFEPYVVEVASTRYFIHSPVGEVRLCCYSGIYFIVISEVYGFEVGSTTVEELVYYGIHDIIGIGYAGAFNGAPMGQWFIVKAAMSDIPLAKHYGVEEYQPIAPDREMYARVRTIAAATGSTWEEWMVWCTNSIYREYPGTVADMKARGCSIVNMDTVAIYAVARVCALETEKRVRYIYVGTVTDSMEGGGVDWESQLIETIESEESQSHHSLIQCMVEQVLPALYNGG